MKKFIDEIEIKGHKGLNSITLSNLGKVNVLCGKNNSGKTTILNAILSHNMETNHILFTISRLDQEHLEFYIEEYIRSNGETPQKKGGPNIIEIIRNQFCEFFDLSEKKFNRESFNDVVGDFYDFLKNRGIKITPEESGKMGTILGTIFSNRNVHLIEPKREFICRTSFSTNEGIGFTKHRFLQSLFHIKNKLSGSSLFSKYERLRENFYEITGGYHFDVVVANDKEDIELHFAHEKSDWYRADLSGLGLFDVLLILFNIEVADSEIILIEEPESHMHPDIQRRLFNFIGSYESKQFFLTTHSNIFLDITLTDKVFHTINKNGITVQDDTAKAGILQDLGYSVSDNLIADAVILTEGPTDRPILEELFSKMGLPREYNIKIWALGGDIMDKQDLSIFTETYKVFALIDRDPKSEKVRKRFEKTCNELGIQITRLKNYAIENYFTLRGLKKVFKSQIPEDIRELNPNKKLSDQIGIDCKRNNRKLAKELNLDEIENTDLFEFLKGVEAFLKSS